MWVIRFICTRILPRGALSVKSVELAAHSLPNGRRSLMKDHERALTAAPFRLAARRLPWFQRVLQGEPDSWAIWAVPLGLALTIFLAVDIHARQCGWRFRSLIEEDAGRLHFSGLTLNTRDSCHVEMSWDTEMRPDPSRHRLIPHSDFVPELRLACRTIFDIRS